MAQHHTLVVLVENISGVLARVAGLFARRGFNIESLTVAPTHTSELSRFTIVVDAESVSMDQVKKQLDKLINVVEIHELSPSESVELEFMLVKVRADKSQEAAVRELAQKYEAKVFDLDTGALILSMAGVQSEVEELENALDKFGILEIQRTGKLAISNTV